MNIKITQDVSIATHITHGGVFHADEVFTTVMFAMLSDVTLARIFVIPSETNAVIYDIGGGMYDHHQKGGNGERTNGIPYSSCGLVWRDYGSEIVQKLGCPATIAEIVADEVDKILVEGIDGADNGIEAVSDQKEMKYKPLNIVEEIAQFNPVWDSNNNTDEAFSEACIFAQGILRRTIENVISKVRAEEKLREIIFKTSGHILVLPVFMPWRDAVFKYDTGNGNELWYIIFPSRRGDYSVQCIPDRPGGFGLRHPFPKSWWGNPVNTGVEGCLFVHPNGFIAACDTLEHAKLLAQHSAEE